MEAGINNHPRKSWKKRILLFLGAFIIVCLVIFIGWRIWSRRGSEKAAGIYIMAGGSSYIVIQPGRFRSLKVTETGNLLTEYNMWPWKNFIFKAEFSNRRLYLKQTEEYEDNLLKVRLSMGLMPSKTIPGDWDMVEAEYLNQAGGPGILFRKIFWEGFWENRFGSLKEIPKVMTLLIKPLKFYHLFYTLDNIPFHSFLHRVNDNRVPEYYQLRQMGECSSDTLIMIRNICEDNPNDPYLVLNLIEMEILCGNINLASDLLDKKKSLWEQSSDRFLSFSANRVEKSLYHARMKEAHPALSPFADFLARKSSSGISGLINWLKELDKTDHLLYFEDESHRALIPPIHKIGYSPLIKNEPDFLQMQVGAKVCRTLGLLYLLQGKRDESLELLCASYKLGLSLNASGSLIQRLIGIAVRAIVTKGLEIYVLNACENPDDLERTWKALEGIHNIRGQETGKFLLDGFCPYLISQFKNTPESKGMFHIVSYKESLIRHYVSDMKFDLIRMAAAARYKLLKTGRFPGSNKDFEPFLSGNLPEDLFSEGAPLRFTQSSDDEFIVYSLGPDQTDDAATFAYDPTNGTVTPGDIIIRIPREREYPFPKEGVKAKNAYELLEQFPNGLPWDCFSDTWGLPLSIIESTETQPVVIFSFGPDTDEFDFIPYSGASSGNVEPVPTPDPGTNPSYGRTLQNVMRRSETIPPPPGCWTLQPFYDPTNGTVSPGDLFIEIPR